MVNEELKQILKQHAVGLGDDVRQEVEKWPKGLAGLRIQDRHVTVTRPRMGTTPELVKPNLTIEFTNDLAAREFALRVADIFKVPAYELRRHPFPR